MLGLFSRRLLDRLSTQEETDLRGWIEHQVLYLHQDDVPQYKKKGSVVRNSYFWAMRSIAGRSRLGADWEYEAEVWIALQRMLLSFTESGYLGLSETMIEFLPDQDIPISLKPVATWTDWSNDEVPQPNTDYP